MITRSRSSSTESPSPELSLGDSAPVEEREPTRALQSKKSRKKAGGRGFPKMKPDQWVCVMPRSNQDTTDQYSLSIVSLKNPSSGARCKYLLREVMTDGGCADLSEILKFSDDPRSWFIGDSVHTDGSLLVCTPIDPLFVALPYFTAAAKLGKFTTLDVILDDTECDNFQILSKCVSAEQWANISEKKGVGGSLVVYRYSKERTLAWLKKKVAALADGLAEEKVYVGKGSQSSMLIKSRKETEGTREEFLHFACGIVKDYLGKDLAREISQVYSFHNSNGHSDSPKLGAKVSGETGAGELEPPIAKRKRVDNAEPLEDYSRFGVAASEPTKAVVKQTAAQKNLAKIDKTGMKSLSSFFKKKPKN